MCARRFLYLVFILILIFVGGAFALYQWGDRVLVRMSTPQGHYQEPPRTSGPDFAKDASWWSKPGLEKDPSRWVPEGVVPTTGTAQAATFYVHPTTFLERDRWNAPLVAPGEPSSRAQVFIETQAGVFNSVSEIWAPRYRQAAFGAFLLDSDDAQKALDLAYRDVLAAFDQFLAQVPQDRPIILAGHSQGSLHLLRLMADRQGRLKGRLVAAYIVGWPISIAADLPAIGLRPCLAADQTECVMSWQSFQEPANTQLVTDAWVGRPGLNGSPRRREDMLCSNPLTGTKDGIAPASANLGTLVPDGAMARATLEQGRVGARCKDGFLMIDGGVPNLGPYVLPGNNYHVYDYALFWGSIRADADRRLTAWRAR